MRFLILIALGIVVTGGYFYEDIDLYFSNEFGGNQGAMSVGRSVGNLGDSLSNKMRDIGGSFLQ